MQSAARSAPGGGPAAKDDRCPTRASIKRQSVRAIWPAVKSECDTGNFRSRSSRPSGTTTSRQRSRRRVPLDFGSAAESKGGGTCTTKTVSGLAPWRPCDGGIAMLEDDRIRERACGCRYDASTGILVSRCDRGCIDSIGFPGPIGLQWVEGRKFADRCGAVQRFAILRWGGNRNHHWRLIPFPGAYDPLAARMWYHQALKRLRQGEICLLAPDGAVMARDSGPRLRTRW